MARHPRLVVPGHAHHVLQRGVAGQPIFRDEEDHTVFIAWLKNSAKRFGVGIHAYVLLPEAVQLLVTPREEEGLGRMMQWVGRQYVPWFNRKYQRAGALWSGRFRATVMDAATYLIPCSLFVERMPVVLGLTDDATQYRWSSCSHHANGVGDPLVTDHPLYWSLGNTPFDREAAYRALLGGATDAFDRKLREATGKPWALGSDQFVEKLEKQVSRPVAPRPRGRPPKSPGGGPLAAVTASSKAAR